MRHKTSGYFLLSALLVSLILGLCILLNLRCPQAVSDDALTQEQLTRGVTLTGWQQTGPGHWRFAFEAPADVPELVLCLSTRSLDAVPEGLEPTDQRGEAFWVRPVPGRTSEITVTSTTVPQMWLMLPDTLWHWRELRSSLQLMALVAFASMGAGILALFCFKPKHELGVFLLYLGVMFGWGLAVLLPAGQTGALLGFLMGLYFPFAVLTPLWLCCSLLHVALPRRGSRHFALSVLGVLLFLVLGTSTQAVLRSVTLLAGMAAVLVVLAVAGVWMAQKYIVYDDGGYHLELPFFQKEGPAQEPEDFRVAVEPAASQPEETPEEGEPLLAAVTVPLSAVEDGSAEALAAQAGANSVLLDMKTDRGQLGFVSQLAMAASAGVNAGQADINRQLQALNSGELYTVARLSCFRDHALAKDETYAIRTNSGYRWTDPEELRWSSPASQAVQDYLVALMVELAQLGFDEILLDNWGYPAEGNLGYIKQGDAYDLEHLSQPVEEFLARAEAALEPYGTRLALRSTWAVLEGEESPGGQTAQLLERYAQRVWLEAPEDGMADLLSQAGLPEGEERLALLVEELDPDLDCSQGIWDPEA